MCFLQMATISLINNIARFGLANFQIQLVMQLDGTIDFDKLDRAVRLSVDQEPVFGCRLVENHPPYWKPLENIDAIEFCSFEETANLDEAVQKYVESPLDMDKDPMIKLRLIRAGSKDTLCIKIIIPAAMPPE